VWFCWIACDEGCTGQLLATLNVTLLKLAEFNDSAAALLPWARMKRANTTAHQLRVQYRSLLLKLVLLLFFASNFDRCQPVVMIFLLSHLQAFQSKGKF